MHNTNRHTGNAEKNVFILQEEIRHSETENGWEIDPFYAREKQNQYNFIWAGSAGLWKLTAPLLKMAS